MSCFSTLVCPPLYRFPRPVAWGLSGPSSLGSALDGTRLKLFLFLLRGLLALDGARLKLFLFLLRGLLALDGRRPTGHHHLCGGFCRLLKAVRGIADADAAGCRSAVYRALPLLNHVGELVGQHLPAVAAGRVELTVLEDDVGSDRVGVSLDRPCRF